jgi:hypothetical protein
MNYSASEGEAGMISFNISNISQQSNTGDFISHHIDIQAADTATSVTFNTEVGCYALVR